MSQRSITSFFAKANETKDIRKNESSPEKHTDKKRVIEDEEKEEGISPRPSKKAKLKSASPTIKKKNEVASISPAKLQKSSSGSADQTGSSPVPEMDNKKLSSESTPSCTKESNTKAEMKVLQIVSDEEILNYNPSKKKYHPVNDAFWTDAVPYIALSRTFQLIEENSSRLKMMEILANFFRSVIVISKKDLLPCVYLCLNQLAPAYEGIELGVAETTLMKAIANTTGRSMQQIKSDSQKTGDLGIVAEESKSKQKMMFKPAPLTVANVFARLKTIASMTGNSAMSKKTDLIQSMLVACRQSESKYLIRSLAGKLRIGLAEQSLLQSLAIACTMTPPHLTEYTDNDMNRLSGKTEAVFKEKVEKVSFNIKTVYSRCPSYDRIIPVLLRDGVAKLAESCIMVPGVPLKPMLALPTKGVTDVFNRFDDITFTCEWKYDGERAQIHIDENGTVSIYSRNSENNTKKYPDIIQRIESVKTPAVKSCILDTEAVAWDKENKKILPFQVLSTRKRKDVAESEVKVQVCVYMFDLLYLNGKSLVEETFRERRRLLYENFKEVEGEWKFATKLDTSDMNEVQQFLEDAVKGNCEGLMIKTLETDATYEIAKRSKNWLKLKKDYMAGMGDSLDLVVVGGYRGKGKRLGTYGGFLLACYDSENEGYQTICKIGTGFSDDDLATHAAFFKDHTIPKPKSYYSYDNKEIPDEWFEPVQVWEIKCADLSISPVYKAALGIVDPEKGISLRFPRFIRIRDDKKAEDATNAEQIADMYNNQDQIKNQNATSTANDEDYY